MQLLISIIEQNTEENMTINDIPKDQFKLGVTKKISRFTTSQSDYEQTQRYWPKKKKTAQDSISKNQCSSK